MSLKLEEIRGDFDCLSEKINGSYPIYFDNACMTLKPNQVINAIVDFYKKHPSCHNRAVHKFGRETSKKYYGTKEIVRKYINANSADEIIFTRNTTESINFIANTLPVDKGDVIISSDLEHNSNLLPWQVLSKKKFGVSHKIFSVGPTDTGENLEEYESLLKEGNVKLVSTFYTSNVTGATLPIKKMAELAHQYGALFLLDAAQAAAHNKIDVKDLGVDFLALSFHKLFGPTGMGLLYGKMDALKKLPPFLVGGETIVDADYASFTLSDIPERFEAGLQNYAGIIGAGEAIKYISKIGIKDIQENEYTINKYITNELAQFPKVRILGPQDPKLRGSVINFIVEDLDSGELSILLDKTENIMARSGEHCCHAWYRKYKLKPSLRLSFSIYNTIEEAEKFLKTLRQFIKYF